MMSWDERKMLCIYNEIFKYRRNSCKEPWFWNLRVLKRRQSHAAMPSLLEKIRRRAPAILTCLSVSLSVSLSVCLSTLKIKTKDTFNDLELLELVVRGWLMAFQLGDQAFWRAEGFSLFLFDLLLKVRWHFAFCWPQTIHYYASHTVKQTAKFHTSQVVLKYI
jgi:hypothetical protein